MTVLFRVAAGPRLGFGHLVRCRSLARALGVTPRVALRGSAATRRRAASLGWRVMASAPARLAVQRPAILVIDDPCAAAAAVWVRAARRLAIPVASLHDVGLAPVASQLSVDGSVGRTATCGTSVALRGPRFAVLDPAIGALRHHRSRTTSLPSVLVALGGGAHAWRRIAALVRALVTAAPQLEVRVAAGFVAPATRRLPAGRLVFAPAGLATELARATVAIVAGGVTAYEACALGVPAVVTAVVPTQRATAAALARAGAVVAGGRFRSAGDARRLARVTVRLLDDEARRRALARHGRRLVDGHGARRVAAAVRRVAHAA